MAEKAVPKPRMPLRTWLIDPTKAWQSVLPELNTSAAIKRYGLGALVSAALSSFYSMAAASEPQLDSVGFTALIALGFLGIIGLLLGVSGIFIHRFAAWASGNSKGKSTAIVLYSLGSFLPLFFLAFAVPSALIRGGPESSLVGIGILIALLAIAAASLVVTYSGLKSSYQASGAKFFAACVVAAGSSAIAIVIVTFLLFLPFVLCCGPHSPISSRELIRSELLSVASSGYRISSPKQVEFKKDEYIGVKSVLGDAAVSESEVQFLCGQDSAELCGGGSESPLDLDSTPGTGSITVNKNTKAYVVVCGDDSKPRYCIAVARQGADARQTCTDACLS